MTEVYDMIEGIILGGKPIGLLKEKGAEKILASLVSFCRNKDYSETKEVIQILEIVKQKIISEAISLKMENIEKMLEDLSMLDRFFWEKNPSLEFGRIDVEILSELQALKIKKAKK